MIMNKISIYVCWLWIVICFLFILDVPVCYGQTGANAALYFIPTKINLYPNHGLAAGEAQDIIDDINRRFRDNDFPARLVNVGVETITADHGGNNNWGGDNGAGGGTAGDGDLTDAEGWEDNNSVSAYGDNEVQNLSNHKGIKVSFVNATHSGGTWPGWCFHCQPTIVVSLPRALDRANNENGRGLTGVEAAAETIMHELGHVMGDLSHGHTFGTGNFMTPSNTRTGTDMDDTQKDAMLEDKYKHAKCVYQWSQNYPGIPLENLFGNGLDEVLDVSGGAGDDDAAFLQNTGHLDIQQIYLVGLDSSTQAVFDDTRNIDVHYRVAGVIPADQSIEATYTLGFDIDDDLGTGAIHGGRLGIDLVVTVLATGRISDGTFQLNGSVEDLVTGTTVNLPGVITYDTDRPFPDDTGLSEPTATIYQYKIPKNLLNWSVDDVPVVVTAGTPTAVRDTTEFIFETKRWLKDPLLQTFGEGVPIPGEPYPFEVTGLEPDSPFQLYLNDTLMLSGQLDSSGGYRGDFVFPPSLTTREPHFLTVLDSTGEFAYGMACPDPSFARLPYPVDDSTHPHTWVFLTWSSGVGAVSHDIYLGENLVDVEVGTDETFRGSQKEPFFIAGFPGYPYPEGLVRGTTYYWRIDEIGADGTKYPGEVWSFTVPPMTAYDPMPADGTSVKGPDVTLSWKPGIGAMLHEVYFGENFDDVNKAIGGISQTATIYNPGILELGKTYYWRIDEFDGITTHKGEVWSFTTTTLVTIGDLKRPGREQYLGRMVTIEGIFVPHPLPMLVTDLDVVLANMPMQEDQYILLVGNQAKEIDPQEFGGAKLSLTGVVLAPDAPLGPTAAGLKIDVILVELLELVEPYYRIKADIPYWIQVQLQPDRYAILFSGGINNWSNHGRYWNDLKFMYKTLVNTYGYPPENIAVLYADGNAEDNEMPVHYSGTQADLETAFELLKGVTDNSDTVFLFTTNHGGGFWENDPDGYYSYGGQHDANGDEPGTDVIKEADYGLDLNGDGMISGDVSWD
ncbi:MAG: hypothetical protein JSV83_01500 [Desulfobacterales bacterium]|nr:MAG: hypothetical protein JSV83_01500 [Desulfobacterales bacterium]